MRIFPIKSRVKPVITIDNSISEQHFQYIHQAKGVIENYLKSKKNVESITISNGDIFGRKDKNMLTVKAFNSKSLSTVSFIKDSDKPFL